MSCAACVARVEKAVNAVQGVRNCSVSLLTNSMNVEGNASTDDIIKAIESAGYGASEANAHNTKANPEKVTEKNEIAILRQRLLASLAFLLPLLYFSMGHMMLGLPLPTWFNDNHVAMALVQMILAGIVLVINQKFFINGFKGILHRAPNMDSLVALGSGASYIYSICILFAMTRAQVIDGIKGAETLMDNFYFEGAATIVTLITVGKMLEAISKGKTTNALKALLKLAPKQATILDGNEEKTVPIEQVKIGTIFIVKPGESIPADGIVLEGSSAVNESALTGESMPIDKCAGSNVASATLNQSGFLKCRATRVGEDTTLSQIIQLVTDASATKAPISKIADKVAGIFVPTVICISVVTFFIWFFVGAEIGFSLARSIAVLVISCPCALGLATPVAIMVGNGVGAKNGILFKTSTALESTGKTQIVVLDKTGTVTKGEPCVTDIVPISSITSEELLAIAKSIESKSEHPLAKAINSYEISTSQNYSIENFEALPGNGIKGTLAFEHGFTEVLAGSLQFIKRQVKVPAEFMAKAEELASNGKTPLLFAKASEFIGIIAVADTLKDDSTEAVTELTNMGIQVVMLTGDNPQTANAIAKQAGIKNVIAGVLPSGKDSAIRQLMEQGIVTMVGDGINDAPALTHANVGMAIGAGASIAIDAADVVLIKNNLKSVPAAIRLGRATIKNIHQNLFWAFIYNVIGIPLAAGCYYKLFGWNLSATFAALAMSLSSFCVVSNALRLNLVNVNNPKRDKKIKNKITPNLKQETNMTKTYNVEGMMCPHCEATVKKALEALPGVAEAKPSHKTNTVEVTFADNADDEAIKQAVTKAGYEFK